MDPYARYILYKRSDKVKEALVFSTTPVLLGRLFVFLLVWPKSHNIIY
jgi:hypothetical protein